MYRYSAMERFLGHQKTQIWRPAMQRYVNWLLSYEFLKLFMSNNKWASIVGTSEVNIEQFKKSYLRNQMS